MKKKIEKGSEEFELFQDFWKFRQDFYIPEESDDYWNEMVSVATGLTNKYRNTDFGEFARKLFLTCMEDADFRWRNKKE